MSAAPSLTARWAAATVFATAQMLLASCAQVSSAPSKTSASAPVAEAAPTPHDCPEGVAAGTRCLAGRDSAGAFYLIAMPADWNGTLVLHAHGGPTLGEPKLARSLADLKRWAIVVKAGYAWAGSSFRQGGVEVRAAAEDTESLRRIFVAHVATPKHTVLHGQSWGASVAAKGAEMFTAGRPYDGVLLTSGVLGGGTRSYDFRLDLRVVYQYLCHNHPRPDEPQYPLWMGLPADSAMTHADLAQRTRECLGLGLPAAQRTPEQARRLKTVVDVIRIPQKSVQSHLNWATFHFQDIVSHRTGGLNPFGNIGARYSGSPDDAALNAGVLRYRADPRAVARFGADTDLDGRIPVPILTVHAIDDPTAFVELESAFRETMTKSGSADHLVQTFTDDHEHSYLADPDYPAALAALLEWIEHGTKPTPESVAERCQSLEGRFGTGCRFRPAFHPAPLDHRIAARERP